MFDRWLYGRLGKLAGIAYTLGIASLIASLVVAGTTTAGLASPEQNSGVTIAQEGTCPNGDGWTKVEDSNYHEVDGAVSYCAKGGSSNSEGCESYLEKGSYGEVLAVIKGEGACGLSHWAYKLANPNNTPEPSATSTDEPTATQTGEVTETPTSEGDPTATPTNMATNESTNTPTNTPSSTPSNTPTDTPTSTPTNTPTSSPPSNTPTDTNTPDPDVTPTITNTPTNTPTNSPTDQPTSTPTNAPEPPNLIDPKVDSLIQDNDGNSLPSPGDVLQYVMTITNIGGSAAENVVFNDSPDPNTGLQVGSVTTTKGTVAVGNTAGDNSVSVNIGTIEVDETVTITFNVTINIGLSTDVTNVSNQGIITGSNISDRPTDDPDTGETDDPTDTPIVHLDPEPTDAPSDPGDPTSEPQSTSAATTSDPQPTSAATTTVLIPVTGVERSLSAPAGPVGFARLFQNIGLGFLGLGLVLQGLDARRRKNVK